jgi:hypothetical protein
LERSGEAGIIPKNLAFEVWTPHLVQAATVWFMTPKCVLVEDQLKTYNEDK